jgi:hypothetical protein
MTDLILTWIGRQAKPAGLGNPGRISFTTIDPDPTLSRLAFSGILSMKRFALRSSTVQGAIQTGAIGLTKHSIAQLDRSRPAAIAGARAAFFVRHKPTRKGGDHVVSR